MNFIGKGVLATSLVASALATSAPAMAQDYRRDRDDTAAIAIGAGILGLAVGAIAASDNDDRWRDRRYDDRRYYNRRDYDRRIYDRRYRVNDGRYYRGDRYSDRGWRYEGRRNDRYRYDDRYYGRRGY